MNRLRQILKDRRGVAFPLIIAIVLVLVMLMCCISEYFRLLIVAQGVRDAVQEAVISTVNDNYRCVPWRPGGLLRRLPAVGGRF